jgi:hypothetical protein
MQARYWMKGKRSFFRVRKHRFEAHDLKPSHERKPPRIASQLVDSTSLLDYKCCYVFRGLCPGGYAACHSCSVLAVSVLGF